MSNKPATPGGGPGPSRRSAWTLDASQAQAVLSGARKALFVMAGVIAVIWIIQVANWADHYGLSYRYGIRPRDVASLPYIFTAPFLHASWTHIEGNSGPLFIFGFLAAYRGLGRFAAVTVVAAVTSGLAAWFFGAANTVGIGASGVVFGYFGYIMVRGLFDRRGIDVLVGAIMALCFAYQFSVLVPQQGIGWQAHIGGLAGGIASGWILRERRAARAAGRAPAVVTAASPPGVTAPRPLSGQAGQEGQEGQGTAKPGKPAAKPAKPGKGFTVDPANPRAELYKQLDDMGL